MSEGVPEQVQAARRDLSRALGKDFDRAVRHRALMLAKREHQPSTPEEWRAFSQEVRAKQAKNLTILYALWPGIGKTHAVANLAESYGKDCPTLVFGLSHQAFEENFAKGEWAHWKGHDTTCDVRTLNLKGYTADWQHCTCGARRTITSGRPTYAPLEYALSNTPKGQPLAKEAVQYSLWVFDEVDFARFLDKKVVTRGDLERTAEKHPEATVRLVASVLLDVLQEHTAVNQDVKQYKDIQHWSGAEFYGRLDKAWSRHAPQALAQDASLAHLHGLIDLQPGEPWDKWASPTKAPVNFAPFMGKRLWDEVNKWLNQAPFNPRIHIVWDRPGDPDDPQNRLPFQSLLRIVQRKYVPNAAPPIVVLDASADVGLLNQVFPFVDEVKSAPKPQFPRTVHVYQNAVDHVTKSTLNIGLGKASTKLPEHYKQLLTREVKRHAKPNSTVGIITFLPVEEDCKRILGGYSLVTEHYYNLRGENRFQDCDPLVLLGYPSANPQGLYEEACALFELDDTPISRERRDWTDRLVLRNGCSVEISKPLFGYQDSHLHALLLQKSRWELYQAFHRSRAYLKGEDGKSVEVLVFTDVPILGGLVDEFLGRHGDVFAALEKLLSGNDTVKVPNLIEEVVKVAGTEGTPKERENIRKFIARHTAWIEAATGTKYVPGRSKKEPGAFWKGQR